MRADGMHVVELLDALAPMLAEHGAGVGVALDLPHGMANARPFQAELETAD